MLRPLPMKHVMLQILTEDLPQASLTLADTALFSPDYRSWYIEDFPDIPGTQYRRSITRPRAGYRKSRATSSSLK